MQTVSATDENWEQQREQGIKSGALDIRLIDGQITVSDPNNPINAELKEWLAKRGIDPDFYIEEEAKHIILNALQDPLFVSAHVDEENGLVIEIAED
jgi:hypothetical protein